MDQEKGKRSVTKQEVLGITVLFLAIAAALFFIAMNEGNLKAMRAHGGLLPETEAAVQAAAVPDSPSSSGQNSP